MVSTDIAIDTYRVLLATSDLNLRDTRTALLQSFGLDATSSDSTSDAVELIRNVPFDLLVLGHTLSDEDCATISTAFRLFRPHGRIVEILPASGADCRADADAQVIGLDGPTVLKKVIFEQLRQAQSNYHL